MQLLTPPAARSRIAFVVPAWTAEGNLAEQGTPFRSLTVASALHGAGHELLWFDQAVDLPHAERTQRFLRELASCRLAVLWLNELYPAVQLRNVLELARAIRAHAPQVPIAVGGSAIALLPTEWIQRTRGWPVDYFLKDYGEHSAPALARAVLGELELADVPGLVTAEHAVPPAKVARLGAEHFTLFREVDLAPYIQPHGGIFGNGVPTLAFASSRGCAKGCAFCYWTSFAPSLLRAGEIVELVADLRAKYGVRQFHIAELDFFAARGRPLELARAWRERVPDCTWFALASPIDCTRYGEADWDLLASGGLAKLELGTETGSARMLARIGKRHEPHWPLELTRLLLRRGIASMHNFLFGLVDEDAADRQASFRLIRELHALDPRRVGFTFRIFQPAPDVPMGDEAIATLGRSFPRDLDEVLSYRGAYGESGARTMPWLAPRDERHVKALAEYFLPMVTSQRHFDPRWKHWLYRGLRRAARWRLARGRFALPLDRALFQRCFGSGWLDRTYVS
jgi:hypothetical protein